MSVRLDEFCESSQSKFADAVKLALVDGVFIAADEISIVGDTDEQRIHLDVMHTLTKIDFELIFEYFDGLAWEVGPSGYVGTYRVIFFLTVGWL